MVYSLAPEEFTIGFSLIDRNEVQKTPEEISKIIGMFFLAVDKSSDSNGEPIETAIPAARCLDLYDSEHYSESFRT